MQPDSLAGAHRFPAEVRFGSAQATLAAALPELDSAQPCFDLSACEQFDSSLVAVLLELSRRAAALGRRCSFVSPSPNLLKLAGLYGAEALLFDPSGRQPPITEEAARPDGPAR